LGAQHDVVSAKWQNVEVGGEVLLLDGEGGAAEHPDVGHSFPVGDRDE
jgi:hypothetical protein